MAQDELDAAEAGKNIGMAILSFISIITLIFYFFVKNALSVIRVNIKISNKNWFDAETEELASKRAQLSCLDVLGVFQATGGKSAGAWQPEESNREGFSRFSSSFTCQGHEERTGEIRFCFAYHESYWNSVSLFLANNWRVWMCYNLLWRHSWIRGDCDWLYSNWGYQQQCYWL